MCNIGVTNVIVAVSDRATLSDPILVAVSGATDTALEIWTYDLDFNSELAIHDLLIMRDF